MTEEATHRLPRHGKISGDLPDRCPLAMEFLDLLEPLDSTTSFGESRRLSRRVRRLFSHGIESWRGFVIRRCFRLSSIGIGGFEGLRDDRQMPVEQAFDGLAGVLQQMPSVGDLFRCAAASVAAWE